jgi:hypothetical protein
LIEIERYGFNMGKQNASRTGLFLIELILSIFFFIIAAAVVLQLFVNSHFISQKTISINNALLYSQNMSEVFLSGNGNFDNVKDLYSGQLVEVSGAPDNLVLLLFDKNWVPVNSFDNADYSIVADYSYDGTFSYLNVYVNGCPDTLEYLITSSEAEYRSALLDTDYIYHQEVKNYNEN